MSVLWIIQRSDREEQSGQAAILSGTATKFSYEQLRIPKEYKSKPVINKTTPPLKKIKNK